MDHPWIREGLEFKQESQLGRTRVRLDRRDGLAAVVDGSTLTPWRIRWDQTYDPIAARSEGMTCRRYGPQITDRG